MRNCAKLRRWRQQRTVAQTVEMLLMFSGKRPSIYCDFCSPKRDFLKTTTLVTANCSLLDAHVLILMAVLQIYIDDDDVASSSKLKKLINVTLSVSRGGLGRLATWNFPGGPVGPAFRWDATSSVEIGQTTYPVNGGSVRMEVREGSEDKVREGVELRTGPRSCTCYATVDGTGLRT